MNSNVGGYEAPKVTIITFGLYQNLLITSNEGLEYEELFFSNEWLEYEELFISNECILNEESFELLP